MRYVLGVDGGGSKAICLAADERGRLLGYGRGGPLNTNFVLRQEAAESLKGAISLALKEAVLQGEQVDTLCISAPMEPGAIADVVEACRIKQVTRAAEGETPRWAARFWTKERVGVTVDAGTGSLARGWAGDGREASSGGWGTTLGDEGSGYWISLRAMIAVLQAHDGRIEKTSLTKSVLEHFGMPDVVDMVFRATLGLVRVEDHVQMGVVHDSGEFTDDSDKAVAGMHFRDLSRRSSLTRDEVASLCPDVAQAAQQGDWKAKEILREAGYELGRLGSAVVKRLGMEGDAFAIVPFGGVFRIGEMVLEPFRGTVLSTAARARIVEPRFEPAVGAVLLALKEIGVAIDAQIIAAIEQSSIHFPAVRVMNGGALT